MKKTVFTTIVLAFFILMTSCQSENQARENQSGNGIEGQSTSYEGMEDPSSKEIADHLAQLSTDVPDVEHATSIVIGPYALVGIDVNGDIDQSEVGSVKYQVVEALAKDPYGAHAAVTADPDILDRIDEMRKEMQNGRPGEAFMDELAAIIGRLIPIIPGEEHRKSEEPTEVNDEKMSDKKESELEDIQDDQSKGRMNDKKNKDQ